MKQIGNGNFRMDIQRIDYPTYRDESRASAVHCGDDYASLDGKYKLHLDYAGEYPHGDSWHYGEIVDIASGQTIWEYKKGDPIRGSIKYPWSADSKLCYFTIINFGDRILQYDTSTRTLKTIFGSNPEYIKGHSFRSAKF